MDNRGMRLKNSFIVLILLCIFLTLCAVFVSHKTKYLNAKQSLSVLAAKRELGANGKFGSKIVSEFPSRGYRGVISTKERTNINNPDVIEEVQKERFSLARHFCETSKQTSLSRNVFYSDKQKLIICVPPKVSSSTWKKRLFQFENNRAFNRKVDGNIHIEKNEFRLGDLNPIDRKKRTDGYFSFLITRHPFNRLVSTFKDKFEGRIKCEPPNTVCVKYLHRIWEGVVRANLTVPSRSVTFLEFVSFVLIEKRNDHWRSMTQLCSPCALRYDYLAKFETLQRDSIFIYNATGLSENFGYPVMQKLRVVDDITGRYMKTLSEETIGKLVSFYADDFLAFGYNSTKYGS